VRILLFPGQGAQQVGMAADLARAFPAAREVLAEVDAALDIQLARLMAEGPEEDLQATVNTQPAILAHSMAVLAVVGGRLGPVAAAAGHSLGEYAAYVAAGSLSVPDAARLVRRRGELMQEAGRTRPGTMAAVLGLDLAAVEAACAAASSEADGVVVAANHNAPDQTVLSGDRHAVERAADLCRAAGARRVTFLKVSGAFHSPLMEPARDGLRQALDTVSFRDPRFPVIANATAQPVSTAAEARRLLAEQLTAPVRWVESIRTAASVAPGATFVEIGPGGVLSGLLRRILPDASAVTLGTAAELERFLA
jgi:[acyl-carrier-protein] S-malonyltransferase